MVTGTEFKKCQTLGTHTSDSWKVSRIGGELREERRGGTNNINILTSGRQKIEMREASSISQVHAQ